MKTITVAFEDELFTQALQEAKLMAHICAAGIANVSLAETMGVAILASAGGRDARPYDRDAGGSLDRLPARCSDFGVRGFAGGAFNARRFDDSPLLRRKWRRDITVFLGT